ncbi:MAG: HEPN domain-containing protein [Phycisphaerae bacterium]
MPADPSLTIILREWIHKAEGDITNASHTLKLGQHCPTETVVFHAQQCVEKYIKAALTFHHIACPKVHDIEHLVRLLPAGLLDWFSVKEQRTLTSYAVTARYPGDFEPISLAEARAAVKLARRVRAELRTLFPKSALSKVAPPQ